MRREFAEEANIDADTIKYSRSKDEACIVCGLGARPSREGSSYQCGGFNGDREPSETFYFELEGAAQGL
jgi:hypothetical protein